MPTALSKILICTLALWLTACAETRPVNNFKNSSRDELNDRIVAFENLNISGLEDMVEDITKQVDGLLPGLTSRLLDQSSSLNAEGLRSLLDSELGDVDGRIGRAISEVQSRLGQLDASTVNASQTRSRLTSLISQLQGSRSSLNGIGGQLSNFIDLIL